MKITDTKLSGADIRELTHKFMINTMERFDLVAQTGKGMYLYDENGREYLDFYAGIAVNSVGNCNEKVVEAVKDQVGDLMQVFNYPYNIPQALLAEKICTTIGMDKIYFQNTGAESTEAMIKLARKYGIEKYGENKFEIISAKKSFHGRTFGSMSATGQPNTPNHINYGGLVPGFTYAEYNNLKSFEDAITENTIAIMVEPVQGEGGVIPATKEFLCGLRKLCDEKGLLLLLDEVQTGFGRTGSIMCYMDYGIKPDIVAMAKGMGGGMPIGGICATEEVAKAFTLGAHGTTYGGHPVSCAASLAAVNELVDNNLSDNARVMGDYFAEILKLLPCVKEVRHKGLLVGVEFDDTIDTIKVKHSCIDKGLLVTSIGNRIIRMVPPLILKQKHCDKAFKILEEAVKENM